MLFASAEKGNASSREISERIAKMITAAGGEARAVLLTGKDHAGADVDAGKDGDVTSAILLEFVRDVTSRGESKAKRP